MVKADKISEHSLQTDVKTKLSNFTKDYMSIVGILILSIVCSFASKSFLTWGNWKNILLQCATISICALGQAVVLLTGNFDLSLGRNVALTGCIGGILMVHYQMNPLIAVIIMLVVGGTIGLCNGLLTAYVGIPAFIATLGLQSICYGMAKVITNAVPVSTFPKSFGWLGKGYLDSGKNIPYCVIIMILIYLLAQFLSMKTRLGRNIYAVGGGREAAFFAGIDVKKYTCIAFVIAGMLAAFSSAVLMSRLDSASITSGNNYEFDAIIGSIIGGISLSGGKGRLIGTLFGIVFLITLYNGMTHFKIDPFMQDVLKGVVLVAAIALDVLRNKRRA